MTTAGSAPQLRQPTSALAAGTLEAGGCERAHLVASTDVSPQGQAASPLLLAAVTAAAYLIAFSYEAAYLSHFALPLHLVHVGPDSVLFVMATILSGFWVFFWGADLLAMMWPKNPILQVKIARASAFIFMIGWLLKNYGFRREALWISAFPVVFYVTFEILWPLAVYRRAGSLLNRVEVDEVHEDSVRRRGLFGRLGPVLGPQYSSIAIVTLIGIFLAYTKGDADATTQVEFLVLASEPSTAVIRMYSDLVVCSRFNASNGTIEPALQFRRISAEHPLSMDLKSIGPLKQKPVQRLSHQRRPVLAPPLAATPGQRLRMPETSPPPTGNVPPVVQAPRFPSPGPKPPSSPQP
jgi:hypothetical protein